MKQATNLYKQLRTQAGSYYEVQVIRGNTTYGMDKLKSVRIMQALYQDSGPQIGGVNSAKCAIELLEESENWPRMAAFEVRARIVSEDGIQKDSNWLSFGTFYTDQRKAKNGNLKIVGYDAMLMMEQSWTDKLQNIPGNWPISARQAATLIAEATQIQFEDLTVLDNTTRYIGFDTSSTARDVLKSIAVGCGGNWCVTDAGKLKLIRVVNRESSGIPAIAGVAVAGVSIVGDTTTPSGGSSYETIQLGMAVKTLESNTSTEAVTGVEIESNTGIIAFAGDRTGYVLKAQCGFANAAIASLCLNRVQGYVYRPFEATSARLDPIAELGDYAIIDNTAYPIITLDWSVAKKITANISAPFEEEVDHEYTTLSETAKQYKKIIAATNEKFDDYLLIEDVSTAIEQNEEAITLIASKTFVDKSDYARDLAQITRQIDGFIENWSGNYVPTLSNLPASDWDTADKKAAHVGDMFFVNSDAGIPEAGYYYRFEQNGSNYNWTRVSDSALTEALTQAQAAVASANLANQTADRAVLLAEDANGLVAEKAKIFVDTPMGPYSVGDLWFTGTEILTCTNARSSGYSASDWERMDTYVDATILNSAVTTAVTSEFNQRADAITAEVSRTVNSKLDKNYGEVSSFGWRLTDEEHAWYSDGNKVMSVDADGLYVEGEIRASSGYIGNSSTGFEITASSIRNRMEAFNDTEHNGVYIGTDGIALGGGNFTVSSSGRATMNDLQVLGGSISIGQYVDDQGATQTNFHVDENGNLYAASGTFGGTIYADHIVGAVSESQLNDAIQTVLNYARNYNKVTRNAEISASDIPPYFRAGIIVASESFYSEDYIVDTGNDSTEYNLAGHYHRITANDNGTVTIGAPYNASSPPSFNIADTNFYRRGVSAVAIRANSDNGIIAISNPGTWAREVNIEDSKKTAYSESKDMLYGYVEITLTNSNAYKARVGISAANVPRGSSEWGLFTPRNPNNPNASTETEKYFTLSIGNNSNSGHIKIYTDSDSTKNYVKYYATKGGYPEGVLFSFDKSAQRYANLLTYAENDNDETIWDRINIHYNDNTITTLPISPNAYNAGRNSYTAKSKTITANGTYTPETNERWNSVVVDVPSGSIGPWSSVIEDKDIIIDDPLPIYLDSEVNYYNGNLYGNVLIKHGTYQQYFAVRMSTADVPSGSRSITSSTIYEDGTYNKITVSYSDGDTQRITLPSVYNPEISGYQTIYQYGYWNGQEDSGGSSSHNPDCKKVFLGSQYTIYISNDEYFEAYQITPTCDGVDGTPFYAYLYHSP